MAIGGLCLPPRRIPWLAFRHRDTSCDHLHMMLMAATFAGRPLGLPDLQRRCDEVHVRLCRHLGLTPPRYHRPAAGPRLAVFCPSRRLRSAGRRRMASDIGTALVRWQPTSLPALQAALVASGSPVRVEEVRKDDHRVITFRLGQTQVPGRALSDELDRFNLLSILDHARRSRRLRGLIDQRHLLAALASADAALRDIYEGIRNDRNHRTAAPGRNDPRDHAGPAPACGPSAGDPAPLRRDPRDGPAADGASGPAASTAGSGGAGSAAGGSPAPDPRIRPGGRAGHGSPGLGATRPAAGGADPRIAASDDGGDAAAPEPRPERAGPGDHRTRRRPVRRRRRALDLLLLARRICRGLGLAAFPTIRRGDHSVRIGFDDGSAVRIHPDIVLLARPGPARASMARSFARALAQAKRWISGPEEMAWPRPRPGGPATPLAGTAEALRAHMAARLRGCRPVCLAEAPSLRQRAAALWKDFVGSGPDVAARTDVVVVLTPQCLGALGTPDALTLERIEALSARHPGITVAAVLTRGGVPRLLSMDRPREFVRSRLKAEGITVELDPADQNDHPDLGVH